MMINGLKKKKLNSKTKIKHNMVFNADKRVKPVYRLSGSYVDTHWRARKWKKADGAVCTDGIHCAKGRADCVVVTADTVYIFEFKLSDNGSAEDALAQIKKNGYAAQYKADGKKIVLIGAGFDEETCTIKDWKTEVLDK